MTEAIWLSFSPSEARLKNPNADYLAEEIVTHERDKIHYLDHLKGLHSAFGFFTLALLGEKLSQITSVVFQGPDNYIFSRGLPHLNLFKSMEPLIK